MHRIFEKSIVIKAKKYVEDLFAPINYDLFFHQYEHSLEVAYRAVELWMKEWLSEEKLEILAISGIFHDSGFLVQYDNNERIWADIAEKFLKEKKYPKEKIELIKNIILATIIDREPKNILEEIIKDADLDNLWRDDFFDKTNTLKKEVEKNKDIKFKKNDWYENVLKLVYKQKFYTKTQNKERLLKKIRNIKKLEEKVKNKCLD